HADQLISSLNEDELQSPFIPFEPSSTDLHYRDPNIYKEMLTTIAVLEKVKLKDEVKTAIKFSAQIDGSVDTMQRDNKFLFLKCNSPDNSLEIKTKFVGVTDSDLKGAAGLEDCVLTGLEPIEKYFQKVCIVLPDIMKHRDIALPNLRSMLGTPYAGGSEETWIKEIGPLDAERSGQSAESSTQAKRTHTLIDGYHRRRPFTTIRNELIINAAINFLEQRLDNEQEGIMKIIVDICGAKSINDFVVASTPLLECAGIVGDDVKEFTDAVFEIFDDLKPNSYVLEKDYTVRILHVLLKTNVTFEN
ncbi:Hypothetical predicted protein, partial [Paramuricea clavata]